MSQFRQAHSKSYERGENEKFSPKDAKETIILYGISIIIPLIKTLSAFRF